MAEGSPIFMKRTNPHNHPPDLNKREKRMMMSVLKERLRADPGLSITKMLKEEAENNNL